MGAGFIGLLPSDLDRGQVAQDDGALLALVGRQRLQRLGESVVRLGVSTGDELGVARCPDSRSRSGARADACWLPIAPGLTPHGLRHTHKTQKQELGVPAVLQDGRMGHFDGSVQARYSHITPAMRRQFLAQPTALWKSAVDGRRTTAPHSPVGVLDRLRKTARE